MELALELTQKAQKFRINVLDMVYRVQSGHLGGSFSAAEIITTLLFHQLRLNPADPNWPQRDRFVLSKGHAAPMLYVALAERGFFPKKDLETFRQIDSHLQGHPDRLKTPGVEMTSGVLGHGLGVGVGLALAARLDESSHRVYVLLGDGELDAGIVWEAALTASKYKLDNLTAIVDRNGVQLDGPTEAIMPLDPLRDKWLSFGWHPIEVDGHNVLELMKTLDEAIRMGVVPTVIIAHTVKGKGVSFMENDSKWHGRPPNKEEYETALKELKGGLTHI